MLHDASDMPTVQRVLNTPTSIGGIRGRGVDNAIALFDQCYADGARFVAGSDISGFFTTIPRDQVLDVVGQDTDDADFLGLLERALTVELSNADQLSDEDLRLFPTGPDGVAQGCPLSALAGNIVLEEFDRQMNEPGRGITCIRYIDDFILIGRARKQVEKAMASAKANLAKLGMGIYDPSTHPSKAFIGKIGERHVFLGYEIVPGEYRPAEKARDRLISQVDALLRAGQISINKAIQGRQLTSRDRCYAQTLTAVDYTVRGWRGSFQSAICQKTFKLLDKEITRRLKDFEAFFRRKTVNCDEAAKRRALGVSVLTSS